MKKFTSQMINKIKQNIDLYLLVCLAFSLPFERIPSFDFYSASIRLSVIFCGLIILRALYLLAVKKQKLQLITSEKILLALLIWIILLIPESINLKRAAAVAFYNTFVMLSALSIAIIFKKNYIRAIIKAILYSAIVVSAFAIYQYLGDLLGLGPGATGLLARYRSNIFGFPRVQSTGLEPLYFASYLLLPTTISLVLIYSKKVKIFSDRILYLLFLLFSTIIFITVSRGGLIALVACFLVASFIAFKYLRVKFKIILTALGLLIAAFTLSFVILSSFNSCTIKRGVYVCFTNQSQQYQNQITSIGEPERGDTRGDSRQKVIEILSTDKPAILIGIGPGQFGPYIQNNTEKADGGWYIVNNLTLEVLVELGLLGLTLLLCLIATIFFKLFMQFKKDSTEPIIRLMAIVVFAYLISEAIQYQTFSTLYIILIWFIIGCGIGLAKQGKNN